MSELLPLFGCVSVLVHIWTLTSVQTRSHFSWMGIYISENGITVLCGTQPFEEHPGHFPKQLHHLTLLLALPADSSLSTILLALVIFSVEFILMGVKWSLIVSSFLSLVFSAIEGLFHACCTFLYL